MRHISLILFSYSLSGCLFGPLLGCSAQQKFKAIRVPETHVESTVTTTSSGTIEAEQQAALGFGVSGRVKMIHTRVGAQVRKGQILAELENLDLKTIHQDSVQELHRSQELFKANLVSKAAMDEAKKNFEIARSNRDKTIIQAPFDGLVSELNLEVGELSQPTGSKERPPIRLIDLKPRIVKGNIDEVDLSKIQVGSTARIRIPALGQKSLEAYVSRVVPFVSTTREQDRTSEIELKFKNMNNDIIPVGASADIEVVTSSKENTLAVPTRVILGQSGQRYVYRHFDNRIHKIPIQIGIGNYDRSEILSGLSKGDIVIFPPDITELKDQLKATVEISEWP
jgi:RND family efflux transporter MFP subunit